MNQPLLKEVSCPDCGAKGVLKGAIPDSNLFAGKTVEKPLKGGGLYRCSSCSLGFRWPRLDKKQLDVLYKQGDEKTWSAAPIARPDWQIGRDLLKNLLSPGMSILDVGCFDGGFLGPLVDLYACNGIEIHSLAAKQAIKKGVTVIGSDFADVSGSFDCITAFDVIEHTEHPGRFLDSCLNAVRSGGYILIAVGNLDALTFRFMGSQYWYCTIPEHISFVSPRWIRNMNCGKFIIKNEIFFQHSKSSFLLALKERVANIIYKLNPSLIGCIRKRDVRLKNMQLNSESVNYPPCWLSAKDHFMVILRKI